MRPAIRLILLALGLSGLSFLVVLWQPGLAGLLAILWLGFAAVAMADLALTLPPGALRLTLAAPAAGYAGQSARIEVAAEAPRPLPDLQLVLETTAPLTPPDFAPVSMADDGPARLTADLALPRRGTHRLAALHAAWPSRWGLWDMLHRTPLDHMMTVLPDITPVLSGQITSQMLPLTDGLKDMALRGDGSEFHQLRDFRPGMDPRSIDWKRSARMRALVSRETRAERNHQIVLGLDTGHLMAEDIAGLTKLDRAINAALAMAWAGGLGGDMVGLMSFDSRPRLWLPPAPGRTVFPRMQAACATITYEAAETNHTLALSTLMSRLKRRSLVILFSDFADTTTAELLVENTAILARRHLVIHVALRDPALQALAQPETSDFDAIAASVAAAQMLRERRLVLDRLARLGVQCLEVAPDALTPALVSRYIDIKSREMI